MNSILRCTVPLLLAVSLLAGCAGGETISSQSQSSSQESSQAVSSSASESGTQSEISSASEWSSQPPQSSTSSQGEDAPSSQGDVKCEAYAPLLEDSPDGYTVSVGRVGREGGGEVYPLTDPAAVEETLALLGGAAPLPPEEQITGEFYENSIYSIIIVNEVEYRFTDWGAKECVLYRTPAQGEVPVLYEPADPTALYSWNEEVLFPVLRAAGVME